jgi:hypothetical protein
MLASWAFRNQDTALVIVKRRRNYKHGPVQDRLHLRQYTNAGAID